MAFLFLIPNTVLLAKLLASLGTQSSQTYMPYVSYNPKSLWQSIMYYAKTHDNKLTKLSYEILAVLAMVKPKNDHDPGNYQIVLEVKNGLSHDVLEKQLGIEEIEKTLLEPNTDLDVGISKVVDGKSVVCYQHQIKRFGYGGKNNTTSDLKDFIEEKVLKSTTKVR